MSAVIHTHAVCVVAASGLQPVSVHVALCAFSAITCACTSDTTDSRQQLIIQGLENMSAVIHTLVRCGTLRPALQPVSVHAGTLCILQ
jgi:hypothetical protein